MGMYSCSVPYSLLFVCPHLSPAEGPSHPALHIGPALCSGPPKTPWDPVSPPHLLPTMGNSLPVCFQPEILSHRSGQTGTVWERACAQNRVLWTGRDPGRSGSRDRLRFSFWGEPTEKASGRKAVFPLTQAQQPRFCAPVDELAFRRTCGGPLRHSRRSPHRGSRSAPLARSSRARGGSSPSSRSGQGR